MMNLNETAARHGFCVDRVRESEELHGKMVEMHHEKTGAQLVWVDNGEVNKTFCVAFKTLPEDSTGVFHILEHSVLCGSAKYPVREPFVELMKSSMATFLNAMTFPDKTIYPVSSRNEQDFLNLTEVYLDAVFAPRILQDPNIFYQEGWHIELDENGALLRLEFRRRPEAHPRPDLRAVPAHVPPLLSSVERAHLFGWRCAAGQGADAGGGVPELL